jgi:quinol monooxygenase YgiN
VIVRMWETRVSPGQLDALVSYVRDSVWPTVAKADGFIGGEVLTSYASADERLLLITRWADEASLEAYLGPDWRAHEMTPIPEEAEFVTGTPFADHWHPVDDPDR